MGDSLEFLKKHNYGGNMGCVASHRLLLDQIVLNRWKRTLILEDDFLIVHENFNERFDFMINYIPETWDQLYLGGGYAEPPIYRVNQYVIHHGRMHTTSSYGITHQFAKKIAPSICGSGPIDSFIAKFHTHLNKCYIFQPRLMIQRPGVSDLSGEEYDNGQSMSDTSHENMIKLDQHCVYDKENL